MDPATLVLFVGFLGGLLIASLMLLLHRRSAPDTVPVPYRSQPLSTDIINVASIKVAGIGGLGLVAMAAAVALDIPRIAQSVGLGMGLGVIGAVATIAWRRRPGY